MSLKLEHGIVEKTEKHKKWTVQAVGEDHLDRSSRSLLNETIAAQGPAIFPQKETRLGIIQAYNIMNTNLYGHENFSKREIASLRQTILRLEIIKAAARQV